MQLSTTTQVSARARQCWWARVAAPCRGIIAAALLSCLQIISANRVWSQEPAPSSSGQIASVDATATATALAQRGTVTFRETPLTEVILILSEQWNVNIIAGAEVQGQVNGTFKGESLKSILDSILISNGLQYRQVGNSLVVLPNADIGGNRSNFRVEVLDSHVANGEGMDELIAALKLQMSPDGQLVPISATGKLTLLDTPDRIDAVKSLLAQLAPADRSSQTYVSTPATQLGQLPAEDAGGQAEGPNAYQNAIELRPQYVMASDLVEPLTRIVGEGNITLVGGGGSMGGGSMGGSSMGGGAMGGMSMGGMSMGGSSMGGGSMGGSLGGGGTGENSLVVFGDTATLRRAELLMQQLDRPRPQVRITGYIYDVDVGELERLGVDWGQRAMSTGVDANGVPNNMELSGTGLLSPSAITNSANTLSGVVTDTAEAGAAGATAVAAGPVGGQFLVRTLSSGFELQALVQALEQTKGSRLLADPHITVVDRHQAVFEAKTRIPIQQLTQTQQGGAIGSTSFVDAGITLMVTPHIANDGTIEMQLFPSFSTLVGYDRDGRPIIDERNASTVVRVNHGQALAIGGLRRKNTVESVRGIPGLMNVKYLGALFRTHDTDVRESELLVFIMPEIVGYCGGLPREMAALSTTQQQLSRISTAVDGPFTPDCKDKYCPQHNERPKIHNGMQDCGLIGTHDVIFIDPQAVNSLPVGAAPQAAIDGSADSGTQPAVATEIQFDTDLPMVPSRSAVPEVTTPISQSDQPSPSRLKTSSSSRSRIHRASFFR